MKSEDGIHSPRPILVRLLEAAASTVLLAVLVSLGWMIIASYRPEWGRLASLETEVAAIVGLMLLALVLVSAVALLHTRK
ncbi:MAG TPA: hypothetical protein VKU82_11920 [Planctomycetaceae bacterium]|nr:hypothetical protein [Planctomycetaceae bacterium]